MNLSERPKCQLGLYEKQFFLRGYGFPDAIVHADLLTRSGSSGQTLAVAVGNVAISQQALELLLVRMDVALECRHGERP